MIEFDETNFYFSEILDLTFRFLVWVFVARLKRFLEFYKPLELIIKFIKNKFYRFPKLMTSFSLLKRHFSAFARLPESTIFLVLLSSHQITSIMIFTLDEKIPWRAFGTNARLFKELQDATTMGRRTSKLVASIKWMIHVPVNKIRFDSAIMLIETCLNLHSFCETYVFHASYSVSLRN